MTVRFWLAYVRSRAKTSRDPERPASSDDSNSTSALRVQLGRRMTYDIVSEAPSRSLAAPLCLPWHSQAAAARGCKPRTCAVHPCAAGATPRHAPWLPQWWCRLRGLAAPMRPLTRSAAGLAPSPSRSSALLAP